MRLKLGLWGAGHQPGSLQDTHKVPYQKPVTEQSTEHVSVSDAK